MAAIGNCKQCSIIFNKKNNASPIQCNSCKERAYTCCEVDPYTFLSDKKGISWTAKYIKILDWYWKKKKKGRKSRIK
jgi:hypothetical protein